MAPTEVQPATPNIKILSEALPKCDRGPASAPAKSLSFHRLRKIVHVVCVIAFFSLPFANLVRFDIPRQRFYFFGYELWISEAPRDRREKFRDELRCPPERILGVLDFLETKWGGVAAYLEAARMTLADIDKLSRKLT